jgi:hypothetical protein
MRIRIVLICLVVAGAVFVACGSGTPAKTDAAKMDSMGSGSGSGPMCTGATYDPCTDNTQCMSAMCHAYGMSMLQVCTVSCASTPCPNDSTGATITCNGMLNCKPTVANHCHR